jgi:hypothetical protein
MEVPKFFLKKQAFDKLHRDVVGLFSVPVNRGEFWNSGSGDGCGLKVDKSHSTC